MRSNGNCNNSHAHSTGLSDILLSVRTQFMKDQNMKIYQHYINARGEVLSEKTTAAATLNNMENGSFRYRENLQFKKTAILVLVSQFMRSNGRCNNSHAPSTGLRGILFSVKMDQNMKNINIISMHGEKFYRLQASHAKVNMCAMS